MWLHEYKRKHFIPGHGGPKAITMTQNEFNLYRQEKSKAQSGRDFKKAISWILDNLKKQSLIRNWGEVGSLAKTGYSYKNEHCPHFYVDTIDEKIIIIFGSNTFRQDRRKISYYDMEGVLQSPEFADSLVSSLFVIGENEQSFINFRNRVKNKEQYCPFENILLVEELDSFFLEYERGIILQKQDIQESFEAVSAEELNFDEFCSDIATEDPGRYAKIGYRYEKFLTGILNIPDLLTEFKKNGQSGSPEFDKIASFITKQLKIDIKEIDKLVATDSVPLLSNGGKAKTDIICYVYIRNTKKEVTFSVKNSTASQVSCHERRASDFMEILGLPETHRLGEYFSKFQEYGSWEGMVSNSYNYTKQDFHICYEPHRRKLAEWVLKGQWEPEGNLKYEYQIAQNIFMSRKKDSGEKLTCQSWDSHINKLMAIPLEKTWDVFSWTYPSDHRGDRIQLKLNLRFFD